VNALPDHLKKYAVEQNYEKYTPVDQACWRYILRQLKSFLSKHAHSSYLEGLEKTGVEIEQIPRIEEISKKLQNFGWRAVPVSGFIPPAAFMELQSLSVLPIASEIRTINHLLYTPAPDIVHEAAGHAPILANPEFSAYLHQYAQVAKKALISKEDLNLYNAIRELSDIKEKPDSTKQEVEAAQEHLNFVTRNISHISEAAELSRMNWWTAEYGLIGDIEHPQIFGAGLLSSVGESRFCLSEKVKKNSALRRLHKIFLRHYRAPATAFRCSRF
jgi:phenylalanine-4-hydroxylase